MGQVQVGRLKATRRKAAGLFEPRATQPACVSHHLAVEARNRPVITSLRLPAVLTVLFNYASLLKKWGARRPVPGTDSPLTHFASPGGEKCRLRQTRVFVATGDASRSQRSVGRAGAPFRGPGQASYRRCPPTFSIQRRVHSTVSRRRSQMQLARKIMPSTRFLWSHSNPISHWRSIAGIGMGCLIP